MTGPRSGDRGAASVWVLGCSALVLLAGVAVEIRTVAVLARHRVAAAADLAALAAAGRIGIGDDGCRAAARIALRNAAVLRRCSIALSDDGRSGTVEVAVAARVRLPFAGQQLAVASARAARLPGSAAAVGAEEAVPEGVHRPHRRSWSGQQPVLPSPRGDPVEDRGVRRDDRDGHVVRGPPTGHDG
jgi:secretion/DNA translocation related TadE-like protein